MYFRFGFHWPPFHSVEHLHLHVLAPASQMGFISRFIYRLDSYWFITVRTLNRWFRACFLDAPLKNQWPRLQTVSVLSSLLRGHLIWHLEVKDTIYLFNLAWVKLLDILFWHRMKTLLFASAHNVIIVHICERAFQQSLLVPWVDCHRTLSLCTNDLLTRQISFFYEKKKNEQGHTLKTIHFSGFTCTAFVPTSPKYAVCGKRNKFL